MHGWDELIEHLACKCLILFYFIFIHMLLHYFLKKIFFLGLSRDSHYLEIHFFGNSILDLWLDGMVEHYMQALESSFLDHFLGFVCV